MGVSSRILEYSTLSDEEFAVVEHNQPLATFASDQDLWQTAGGLLLKSMAVIAESGSQRLLSFSQDGRFQGQLAGRGDGPGEFRDVAWIGGIRDGGFAVWDRMRMTVSFYDSEAGYRERRTYPTDGIPGHVALVFGDGSALVQHQIGALQDGDFVRRVLRLSVVSQDLSRYDSVFVVAGPQLYDDQGVLLTPQHARRPLFAAGPESTFVYSPSEPFELLFFVQGQLTTVVRRSAEIIPTTVPGNTPASAHMHTTVAPVQALFVDPGGNAWVRPAHMEDAPTVDWEVYSRHGDYRGSVRMPADLRILDMRDGRMLALRNDQSGRETPGIFRVEHVNSNR